MHSADPYPNYQDCPCKHNPKPNSTLKLCLNLQPSFIVVIPKKNLFILLILILNV